jgi:predicted nucleic acid-binding protein
MSDRSFVDTNVLVYLFDADAVDKQAAARRLLASAGEEGDLILSTQVLKEFYVSVTRKLGKPLPPDEALKATRALGELPVVQVDPETIYAAIELGRRFQLSFWDALIVEAARRGDCDRLLSEDLQDGQEIAGVRVVNPFAGEVA